MDTIKKQTKRTFPEAEKLRFVREFLSTRMSKAAFAQMNNIDRKALGRWIDKYGDIVQKELTPPPQPPKEDKIKTADSDMMVTIPSVEYLELLNIKNKYEVMCAFSHI